MDFVKTGELVSQEDQGMTQLQIFNNLITELQQPPEATEEQDATLETELLVTASTAKVKMDKSSALTPRVTDMMNLTDVAAVLPCR